MSRFYSAIPVIFGLATSAFGAIGVDLCDVTSHTCAVGTVTGSTFTATLGTDSASGSFLYLGPSDPLIDLSSITISASGTDSIAVVLSASGFTQTAPGFTLGATGQFLTGSGTAAEYGYYDNTDTLFGSTLPIGPPLPSTGVLIGEVPLGSSGSFAASDAGTYSLTDAIVLSGLSGLVSLSSDTKIAPVPEPASVALLGGILFLTVSGIRRKIRQA